MNFGIVKRAPVIVFDVSLKAGKKNLTKIWTERSFGKFCRFEF